MSYLRHTIIGLHYGLSRNRYQAITKTNDDFSSITPQGMGINENISQLPNPLRGLAVGYFTKGGML